MQSKERKFGEIPAWAKLGPVTGKNFAFRAESYCAAVGEARGGTHPTVRRGMPEFYEWWQYFERHLKRIPVAFQRLIDEPHSDREYTVPEMRPELFDATFVPNKAWSPRLEPWEEGKSQAKKDEYVANMKRQLREIGFPFGGERKTVETPEKVMDRYGISQDQWNAIPDLPKNHEDKAANKRR